MRLPAQVSDLFGLAAARGSGTAIDLALNRPRIRFNDQDRCYYLLRDGAARYHLQHSVPKWRTLASVAEPDDLYILDVGAHCGIFAAMVAATNPKCQVACIEPDPSLHSTIGLNLRDHGQWTLIPAAVADRPHRATLYRNPDSTQTNSLDLDAVECCQPGVITEKVEVEVTTIDAVVAELAWPRVDLLKIDIQGLELSALKGADVTLGSVGKLLIEVTLLFPGATQLLGALEARFGPGRPVSPVIMGADLLFTVPG